jgi:hypothetical protein
MPKTHTVYDAMAFPPHVHREYPKHLRPRGAEGPTVVVLSEEEELAALLEADASRAADPAETPAANKPKETRR